MFLYIDFWSEHEMSFCCILTLDGAINQWFSAQDAPVKKSRSSHVVEQKCLDVMKWYMQMPTWDRSCLSLESVMGGLPVEYPWPRSRSAKWGFEGNTAWYGYGSMWQSPFISLMPQKLDWEKWEFCFYNPMWWFLPSSWLYKTLSKGL